MNRVLVSFVLLAWSLSVVPSTGLAEEHVIEAKTVSGDDLWDPDELDAAVGDVVEWKLSNGFHGLRITNWDDVKSHVQVETVSGQQPFNSALGQNGSGTSTAGKVLARLKVVSPPPGEITYECIIHTTDMEGTISVASPTPVTVAMMHQLDMTQALMVPSCSGGFVLVAPGLANNGRLVGVPVDTFVSADPPATAAASAEAAKTVKSLTGPLRWEPNNESVEVGEEIQWVNGGGPHGLRITNWNDVKDSIEVVEVHGSPDDFAKTGETPASTNVDLVYARLKVNSVPAATDTIKYNCVVHGNAMTGTVQIVPPSAADAGEAHAAEPSAAQSK